MQKKYGHKFVIGTDEDEVLQGNNLNQDIFGKGGNDTVYAGSGNDSVFGARGDDLIYGESGNDNLRGGRGDDTVDGGSGNDELKGGSGNDLLLGAAGNDELDGGRGNDLLFGGTGNDHLNGGRGNDLYLFRAGTGHDTIEHLNTGDRIDLRDFHLSSFQSLLAASRQSGHDVVIKLDADKIVLEDVKLSELTGHQFILSSETQGPSSTETPYLVASDSHVVLESILTAGDVVGGYRMAGLADGLGAFDNGDGTFTVLMNHELGGAVGAVRAHGAIGSFVSEWVIDKTTFEVLSGEDLMQHSWMYNPATQTYEDHSAALGNGIAFSRFCSADLADESAFYNPASGLGYNAGRLFLNGEEAGAEGRAMAHIVGGPEDGNSYELAWLGNMAYENVVASPDTGDKTVVAALDDGTNGQVYFYVGDKQASGNAIEKAGLTGGHFFGIQVADFAATSNNAPNSRTPLGADNESGFSLVDLGDVSGVTGAELDAASEAAGVASFLRPEDGAGDTVDPGRFYFVSTNGFNAPSQLWALDFNDAANPAAGGTIKLLLDGSEGQQMLDNLTVDSAGNVILQEDPGNNAHIAKVWKYDPALDSMTLMAQHDPGRFLSGATNFLTQDEESSGVIEITDILGNGGERVFLLDVQAHYTAGLPADQVEGGQLLIMHDYLI